MIRVARFGKLYKLVKLVRLLRMLKLVKVMKNRDNLIRHLSKVVKVNVGYERFVFIVLVILMVNHISACLWITIASFEGNP